jgi:hypothetical protein
MSDRMTRKYPDGHGKQQEGVARTAYISQAETRATHCLDCETILPKIRRVFIRGQGAVCYPCHAKRWS